MSRMIDAEKLLSEIQLRKKQDITMQERGILIDVETAIKFLQQEQPELELKPIWHNVAEEVPTEIGAEVVVACKNKNKECGIWLYDLIQCWEGEWKPRLNWETPIRWAYVRDLDNARKKK